MIECTNLTINSLKNMDFYLQEGRILGLLGKTGAGKTTLLSALMGVLDKSHDAQIKVMGYAPGHWPDEVKNEIGYVPQRFYGFDALSISEAVNVIKPFYKNWDDELVERLIAEFSLPAQQMISTLSEGQKQLVSIVLAMAFHPKLLVLDEPVASLDPLARRIFLEKLIENHCDHDASVIFSTHITSDLERIASDLVIIKEGKAIISGDLECIRESVVRIKFSFPATKTLNLDGVTIFSQTVNDGYQQLLLDTAKQNIEKRLAEQGATNIHIEHVNLDDLFLELHL